MITKYKVLGNTITQVQVVRETDACVWTPEGRRESKANTYFDTWTLAHEHMLGEAHHSVELARRKLATAHDSLGNVKGMKEPKS